MFAINTNTGRKIVRAECTRTQMGFVSITPDSFEQEDGVLKFEAAFGDFEVTDTSKDVNFADDPENQGFLDDSGEYCDGEDIELVESA